MSERYQESEEFLERARRVIPLGAQTFSKSYRQLPRGAAPFFLERGKGCRVWDLDGNQYVDFINALLAVSLGYCDPDVDAAVAEQMQQGVSFSLAHPLELEVAELICEMVPCAEQVRFGKNGSDVTAAAIRLSRAHTGRDHVAVCGYHGWHDWYIGTTSRDQGVPAATKALTHSFRYNDLESLQRIFAEYPDDIAAVIMEPMGLEWPQEGFLEKACAITREAGAVFVFDEMITGFRFARGGAQELFAVTPDLATFGKGLANGHPVSALVGSRSIMERMDEVFFSGTFGGETLSLAAAKAVLMKIESEPVIDSLAKRGSQILEGTRQSIDAAGLEASVAVVGHPAWSALRFEDSAGYGAWQLRTFFLQELFARGILSLGSHNLSYAHDDAAIEQLLAAYGEIFPLIRSALDAKDLAGRLNCAALEPVLQVREPSRGSRRGS